MEIKNYGMHHFIAAMRKMPLTRNAHSTTQLYLHLVFVTKYRRDILDEDQSSVIRDRFAEHCRSLGRQILGEQNPRADMLCHLIQFGMEANHVHLLVRYPATVTVSDLVKHLKGRSSREGLPLRKDALRSPSLWATGYFAKTVGHTSARATQEYVEKQGTSVDGKGKKFNIYDHQHRV